MSQHTLQERIGLQCTSEEVLSIHTPITVCFASYSPRLSGTYCSLQNGVVLLTLWKGGVSYLHPSTELYLITPQRGVGSNHTLELG